MLWSLLLGLFKGPLDRILSTVDRKIDSETERQRIKSETVEKAIDAEISARTASKEIRVATAGFLEMRIITFLIAGCFVSHLVLVTIDTNLQLGWGIAKFPAPFDEYEGTILLSFFGLQAASSGIGAIAAAIMKRK